MVQSYTKLTLRCLLKRNENLNKTCMWIFIVALFIIIQCLVIEKFLILMQLDLAFYLSAGLDKYQREFLTAVNY